MTAVSANLNAYIILSNYKDFIVELCQVFNERCILAHCQRCDGFPSNNVSSFVFSLRDGQQLTFWHVWQAQSFFQVETDQGLQVKVRLPSLLRSDRDDDDTAQRSQRVFSVLIYLRSSEANALEKAAVGMAKDLSDFYWFAKRVDQRSPWRDVLHIREVRGSVHLIQTQHGRIDSGDCDATDITEEFSMILETADERIELPVDKKTE